MPERTDLRPSDVKTDLETLARARIYFGHQSVGNNVLEGLALLANDAGVRVRVLEAPAGFEDDSPALVHARVGKNREPETKCDAFARVLAGSAAPRWDAAVLKFCYADLGDRAERDPARLLDQYKRSIATVRTARPDLILVHATVPLNSDGLGKRDKIKKLFGMGTSNDADNKIRNQFNDLLRAEYKSEPVFDVAWAESTRPDGTRTGFRDNGKFFFSMAPEYTYDEGHLTPAGQRWVAREFARSLAAALRERQQQRQADTSVEGGS